MTNHDHHEDTPICMTHPCAMVRLAYTQPRATAHQPQLSNQAEEAEEAKEVEGVEEEN